MIQNASALVACATQHRQQMSGEPEGPASFLLIKEEKGFKSLLSLLWTLPLITAASKSYGFPWVCPAPSCGLLMDLELGLGRSPCSSRT